MILFNIIFEKVFIVNNKVSLCNNFDWHLDSCYDMNGMYIL